MNAYYYKKFILIEIYILIQFYINCQGIYKVESVDPPHIKINEKQIEDEPIIHITIIFDSDVNITDKTNQTITLTKYDNAEDYINCSTYNVTQDIYIPNKIIFAFEQKKFFDSKKNYGKYNLSKINDINIYYNQTILIYLNNIELKNPINRYELVVDNIDVSFFKYEFKNEILKEYINKIIYIENKNVNVLDPLNIIIDKKNLIIKFNQSKTPNTFTFYIIPEYDKDIDYKEAAPRFFIHYQEYILLNDAIYIRRNYYKNSIYFKIEFKNKDEDENYLNLNSFNIYAQNSNEEPYKCDIAISTCNISYCICAFDIGNKNEPEILTVDYLSQKRDLFLILYTTVLEKCLLKKIDKSLEIKFYWVREMEYDHYVYFNDNPRKVLTNNELTSMTSTKIVNYKIKSTSLGAGTFSLFSLIPDLSNINKSVNINPVDDKSLNITIYPGSDLIEENTTTLFTHNNSIQEVVFNSISARAFDQIILKKTDNKIIVSVKNGDCIITNNTKLVCYFNDILKNFDKEKEGNYSITYKSICDEKEFNITGKFVIIKKGASLLDITPNLFFINKVEGEELNLQYDDDMTNKNLTISIYEHNKENITIKSFKPIKVNNEYVTIKLENLTLGYYHIKTNIDNEIEFSNNNKGFIVMEVKTNFSFSHEYFVLYNNASINNLIITVEGNTDKFDCMIQEDYSKEDLIKKDTNCKTFYYNINRSGIITFNYKYIDYNSTFFIPINKSITVVPYSLHLFELDYKNCYYYKFNILFKEYNIKPNYFIFLYNENNIIKLNTTDNSNNKKYSSNEIKNNINKLKNGYYIMVSEGQIDTDVYLFKSTDTIKVTNISVPEYIIKPNLTITFQDITCNLSDSKFEIINYKSKEISNYLGNCTYKSDYYLFCNINNNFYKNNPFGYYFYTIDNQDIKGIDNEYLFTYISNRLNESFFTIKKMSIPNNVFFTIKNQNDDFYIKLLSKLVYYKTVNQRIEEKTLDIGIIIEPSSKSFTFSVVNEDNFKLKFSYLERSSKEWETNLGDSIYYNFTGEDSIYENILFTVEPTLFAFYDYSGQKDNFKINITFLNSSLIHTYNNTFEKLKYLNTYNNNSIIECLINTSSSSFNKNKGTSYEIKIKNNTFIIDFIYYHLEDIEECKLKNDNITNYLLNIEIPENSYQKSLYLKSESWMTVNEPQEPNLKLIYTLIGIEINLIESKFSIYNRNNTKFKETFTLQQLGIKVLPIYDLKFSNNEKSITLLPENNQYLDIYVFVKGEAEINLDDIKTIGIEDNQFYIAKKKGITISVKMNLKDLEIGKYYSIYYVDKCYHKVFTEIKISVSSFSVTRNYFVLNNNDNKKTQRLIFYGPHSDNVKIKVYKDNILYPSTYNESYYYCEFNQYSKGSYTFKFDNNGNITELKETIFVVNKLEDLFDYTSIPSCMFLNDDKSSLNYFNYSISKKDERIKKMSVFQSKLIIDKENFDMNPIGDEEEIIFKYETIEKLKNKIYEKNEYYIKLSENNDTAQPLYIFKFRYTNIKLNQNFSEYIYTDNDYISLEMSCKIDNIDRETFYLISQNSKTEQIFQCEERANELIYANQFYKCFLSNDNKKNPLINYGVDGTDYDYGKYFIKYTKKKYNINKNPFFLSHEIITAGFFVPLEGQIDSESEYIVKITTPTKIFYFKNIEKLYYDDNQNNNNEPSSLSKYDNYLQFPLFIEQGHNYTITKICRIHCQYCKHSDCWNLEKDKENYTIRSTTKIIFFYSNRNYIALYNSTDNKGNNNIDLIITVDGQDANQLENIKYNHSDGFKSNIGYLKKINNENNEYILENKAIGKYEFNYTLIGDNSEYIVHKKGKNNKKLIVLISAYSNEVFNFPELDKNCYYYNSINKLLYMSITKNEKYTFKDYVDVNDMIIRLDNKDFFYTNNGFKIYDDYDDIYLNKNYSLQLKEEEFKNKGLVYTTLNEQILLTNFDLNSTISFFYKDNIVLTHQDCYLDNIYIKEENSNKNYYKLKCNYDKVNKKSYCDANYSLFNSTKSDSFQFFIGYPSLYIFFDTGLIKLIYNAIKDSFFNLNYRNHIINITSNNFIMKNIDYIKINNNIFEKPFISQNDDSISLDFIKINDSSIKYNVTELIRKYHYEDTINVIKNKLVNLEIIEKECPEFSVYYLYSCTTCQLLSISSPEYSNRIWYQDGDCVTSCNFLNGYGIYSVNNHYCYKCDLRTKIDDNNFLCGCLEGTVKSFDDEICYLPESEEIKALLIKKKNAQCYREDGKTHNYCNNNNTKICETYSVSGHLFPQCICKEGYIGKYCEYSDNSINLEKKMNDILSNNEIDDGDIITISNIRGVIFFLEIDGDEYIKKINEYIDPYIKVCIKKIDIFVKNNIKKLYSQIYDILELAIYFLKYKITKPISTRSLQEDKDNLNYILKYIHYCHFYGNRNITQDYNIQIDGLGLTSFITYKKNIINSDDFKLEMGNTTLFKILEYVDMNTKTDDDLIFVTLINNTLYDDNDNFGVRALFSSNNSIKENDLNEMQNITYYVSSLYINFNFHLAQYYQDKKIKIYDKRDQAFVEPCFLSKHFDFDLTQKYRKNNVYQKIYYGSENCDYISFDSKYKRLLFNCSQFDKVEQIEDLYYGILSINMQRDTIENANKVYNLPFKCPKKIDDLGKNFAFWLFLIICILEIFYIIGINILTFGSLKKLSFKKGLIHDELYHYIPRTENENEEEANSNDEQLSKTGEKNSKHIKTSRYQFDISNQNYNNNEDYFNKSFIQCILNNFKELHPIATLCRVSLISPLILHSWLFVFNTLILFGFNALLYYENLIEKRIFDKKRNNFDYPMRKEFHKIILSILCQVVLTLLIKLLLFVKLEQRENLKIGLTKCTLKVNEYINNEIVTTIEQFQEVMLLRRLIGAFLMLILIVFFFYYSTVFCGIYINTQYNWFYSGIWSLFWNWIIFAPIFIVIISYIEYKKKNSYIPIVYNLKRLFCF